MSRPAYKDKAYADELEFQRLEFEFRRKQIESQARSQDRNPDDLERGKINALKALERAAKELLEDA